MKSKTSFSFQASSLKRRSVAGGVDHRLGLHAHHAPRGVLPERHVVLPEAQLRCTSRAGLAISRAVISMKALPMFSGSGACSCVRLALQPFADDALRAFGDVGHRTTDLRRVGQLEPGGLGLGPCRPYRVLSVGTTTSYIRARPGADSTMLSSGSGGQPRGAGRRVQAGCGLESGSAGLRFRSAPLARAAAGGCSSFPASMNPVSWWHDLQGGKIAEERPPPPGADQPYPNLASVPPKPAQPDRAALANIASALVADRANAQHVAAAAPIADPSLPSASPGLFGRGTVPPPPPAPPPAPRRRAPPWPRRTRRPLQPPPTPAASGPETAPAPATAPVGTVQSAPLAPPGATAQPPAVEAAPPPPLPASPPPPPNLPGVASTAPPSPPAPPPTPAPAAVAVPAPAPAPAARRLRARCPHRCRHGNARAAAQPGQQSSA